MKAQLNLSKENQKERGVFIIGLQKWKGCITS